MTAANNARPAPTTTTPPHGRAGEPVYVDSTLISLACGVLDHCTPAPSATITAPWSSGLANRLRHAIGAAGCPPRPPHILAAEPAPGRLERDELAVTINHFLRAECRGLPRQVDAALVHEAVQTLRRENPRWQGSLSVLRYGACGSPCTCASR